VCVVGIWQCVECQATKCGFVSQLYIIPVGFAAVKQLGFLDGYAFSPATPSVTANVSLQCEELAYFNRPLVIDGHDGVG
jgi:hypothetical protein